MMKVGSPQEKRPNVGVAEEVSKTPLAKKTVRTVVIPRDSIKIAKPTG